MSNNQGDNKKDKDNNKKKYLIFFILGIIVTLIIILVGVLIAFNIVKNKSSSSSNISSLSISSTSEVSSSSKEEDNIKKIYDNLVLSINDLLIDSGDSYTVKKINSVNYLLDEDTGIYTIYLSSTFNENTSLGYISFDINEDSVESFLSSLINTKYNLIETSYNLLYEEILTSKDISIYSSFVSKYNGYSIHSYNSVALLEGYSYIDLCGIGYNSSSNSYISIYNETYDNDNNRLLNNDESRDNLEPYIRTDSSSSSSYYYLLLNYIYLI